MKNQQLKRSAIAIAVAGALTAMPLQAQMLEEVIVTATKRAVGMQDVPIALAVMSGDKISEQGISSLTDVAVFMPNVHIAEASAGDQLFIRGIGSGVNYAFEQSVGTFIDGVYFGRGQASRSSFLDIARVEVLKGSQSTLFGKNTIAGAINITTAKAGDEFEGSIEVSAEPEFGGQSATLTLSGPVTDNFGARFVVKSSETDGWMDNTFLNNDEVAKDDQVARITLDWQPTDELDVSFKYETGESEATGSNETITKANPTAIGLYSNVDPNFAQSTGIGYKKSDANFGGIRNGDTYHDSEWDIATLTVEWALGEHTLKSITGHVDYQFDNYRDSDYSPLHGIARGRDEEHTQFTQEFLLTSPQGDSFEYLAGLYYQEEELKHDRLTDVSMANLLAAGLTINPIVNILDPAGGGIDATGHGNFSQDAETLSAFFQGTFHFSDDLRLIAGVRYSEDEKEFDKSGYFRNLFDGKDTPRPANADTIAGAYDALLNLSTEHTFANGMAEVCKGNTLALLQIAPGDPQTCTTSAIETKRTEDHVTGDITFQWDANEDMMLYAKWGNGYKAGGFDEDNGRGNIAAQQYEDESSETIEIGAKIELLEGRGRLNIAVFSSEFEDVQVSTFDGNAGFVVGNAAETEVEGIEIDGMFAITEDLTLSYAAAYLDAKYKSFKDAGCNEPQILDWIDGGGTRATCVQDLSGEPLQFTAEFSGNLGLNYSTELSDSLELNLSVDAMYSDEYDTGADQDPLLVQDSFTKINARIGLADVDGVWSIALLGKNLTDKTTSTWGNDVPLASLGFSETYFQIIDAPRSYEIQAKYNF